MKGLIRTVYAQQITTDYMMEKKKISAFVIQSAACYWLNYQS
jgi:hypothetical protein